MKLLAGICGFGVVGNRRFECLQKNKDISIEAVCDRKFAKNYKRNNIYYYNDYNELLKHDLDLIFICVTNDVAAKYTKKALIKNINVFCEKPPGKNLKEIKSVYDLYKRKKHLKLKYGFNHRYHYSVLKALKIINSKKLGKIINLKGTYGKSNFGEWKGQENWRTKKNICGGGILLDQGIHMVDLIRLFAGEFYDVKSFISNNYWKEEIEDNAYAIMKSEKNIIAFIHSSATQWEHLFELYITLEKGYIILRGFITGSKSYGKETITIGVKQKNKSIKRSKYQYLKDPSWQLEVDEFIDSIINNNKIKNGNCEDALKTMSLVTRIYKSKNYE